MRRKGFIYALALCLMSTLVGCDIDEMIDSLREEKKEEVKKESYGVDSRFVGTWVRDASVANIVEEVYTLTLKSDATASYSWYRNPKSNSVKGYNHHSDGTWKYDEESNRIVTSCISDGAGAQAVIFNVIDISETTLTVKMEGADKSRVYTKK